MTNPARTMLELAERLDNMETHQRKNMGGKNRFNNFLNGTLAHEAADALRAAANSPSVTRPKPVERNVKMPSLGTFMLIWCGGALTCSLFTLLSHSWVCQ